MDQIFVSSGEIDDPLLRDDFVLVAVNIKVGKYCQIKSMKNKLFNKDHIITIQQ